MELNIIGEIRDPSALVTSCIYYATYEGERYPLGEHLIRPHKPDLPPLDISLFRDTLAMLAISMTPEDQITSTCPEFSHMRTKEDVVSTIYKLRDSFAEYTSAHSPQPELQLPN